MNRIAIALAMVGVTAAVPQAQGPPSRLLSPQASIRTQSATQAVSSTVMATWVASVNSDGGRVLQLLVLWRGTPGWFARGSGAGVSSGGDGRRYSSTLRHGGLEIQMEFEFLPRLATIQGNRVELGDDNVVFLDGVDTPGGLRVVRTLRVDSTMTQGDVPRIDEVMRRSPEILSFLQCETRPTDPLQQKLADIVCARVVGKYNRTAGRCVVTSQRLKQSKGGQCGVAVA